MHFLLTRGGRNCWNRVWTAARSQCHICASTPSVGQLSSFVLVSVEIQIGNESEGGSTYSSNSHLMIISHSNWWLIIIFLKVLLEKKYAYDKSLSALRFHPWFPYKYNYVIQLYWRKEKQALHAFYTHPCHRLFPVFVFLFVILSLETNMSLTVGSDVSHTILICKHCADTHILVLMS